MIEVEIGRIFLPDDDCDRCGVHVVVRTRGFWRKITGLPWIVRMGLIVSGDRGWTWSWADTGESVPNNSRLGTAVVGAFDAQRTGITIEDILAWGQNRGTA